MIAKDKTEKFVAYWSAQDGSERSRCHQFWDSLLGEVLGVKDLKRFIEYEKPVYFNDGTTKSLDGWIPSTKVLIEHKSNGYAKVPRLFDRYAKLPADDSSRKVMKS